MKRCLSLGLAALLLLTPCAGLGEKMRDYYGAYLAAVESGDAAFEARIRAEMPARLYPARDQETGLMGYINYLGEWAIAPQFAFASLFRGNYACVRVSYDNDYSDGIIDREGSWVVEPCYIIDEGYDGWTYGGLNRGIFFVYRPLTEEEKALPREEQPRQYGYFDVPSGYFSGIRLSSEPNRCWGSSPLMPMYDGETPCYVDRATGEAALRLPENLCLDDLWQDSDFHQGWAMAWDEETDQTFFISEQGELVEFAPDMECRSEDSACGLVRVKRTVTQESGFMKSTQSLYGYYDLNKRDWLIPPCLEEAYPFSASGYAFLRTGTDEQGRPVYGFMDRTGAVIASGFQGPGEFLQEYAYLKTDGLLIDAQGNTVVRVPEGAELTAIWDDELCDERDAWVSPEGLMELYVPYETENGRKKTRVCVMNLRGEWVISPDAPFGSYSGEGSYEWHRFFSCGLEPVSLKTQDENAVPQVGYVNSQGEVVIDFLYSDGAVFLDGLALVEKDGQRGYIDPFGHEIYFWKYLIHD